MNEYSSIITTAIDLQKQGKLEEAASIYRRILDIQPSHSGALHLMGLIFHSKGNFQEAIELFGKAIIQTPDVADFHSNMAAAQLTLGHANSAIRHAQKAIQLDSKLGNAHYNLGNALFSLGETYDAVSSFLRAVELNPKNDEFWSNYLFALNFSPSVDQSQLFLSLIHI